MFDCCSPELLYDQFRITAFVQVDLVMALRMCKCKILKASRNLLARAFGLKLSSPRFLDFRRTMSLKLVQAKPLESLS